MPFGELPRPLGDAFGPGAGQAHQHRQAARGGSGSGQHGFLLGFVEHRGFARAAAGHEAGDAAPRQVIDPARQRRHIDPTVAQRGHQRNPDTREIHHHALHKTATAGGTASIERGSRRFCGCPATGRVACLVPSLGRRRNTCSGQTSKGFWGLRNRGIQARRAAPRGCSAPSGGRERSELGGAIGRS